MKQQITLKQLEELQGEAKDKFLKWVEEKRTHEQYIFPKLTIDDYLFSIGEMIEFLTENGFHEHWLLFVRPEELCDDLWEAVKQVLTS